jgi:diaminohydroxyphosphoribosylaminopyrimidine deaminase/5-amino-6-(5-phosphoribosylamino)uracil reductase
VNQPSPLDLRWLAAADRMARPFVGATGKNPTVGAIIVEPTTGHVLGRGVTAPGGRPHAEPIAIGEAGARARGATLYVTLEPCHHEGARRPCVETVTAAGIKRVVTYMIDPDPRTSGKSMARLAEAGIETVLASPKDVPPGLFEGFIARQKLGRPFVNAKLAVSADGKIGRRGAGNVPITGDAARRFTHALRARNEAILVGAETARLDDPLLDVRLKGLESRSPRRWVMLGSKPLQAGLRMFSGQGAPSGVLVSDPAAASGLPEHVARLSVSGWPDALAKLAGSGVQNLLVEGGGKVISGLLAAGLVDRFYLLENTGIVGEGGVPAVPTGTIREALAGAGLVESGRRELGDDSVTIFERGA